MSWECLFSKDTLICDEVNLVRAKGKFKTTTAMKIAGARVENKRLAPSLAIFMLGGAPKAHEF